MRPYPLLIVSDDTVIMRFSGYVGLREKYKSPSIALSAAKAIAKEMDMVKQISDIDKLPYWIMRGYAPTKGKHHAKKRNATNARLARIKERMRR